MSREEIAEKFKVGSYFMIKECPKSYCTHLGHINPLNIIIDYPYYNVITDIFTGSVNDIIPMTDINSIGWDLYSMIESNIIEIITKEDYDNHIKEQKQLKKAKVLEITNKLLDKGYIISPNSLYKIASDIYGEDKVDVIEDEENNKIEIIIHFPEIDITNSNNEHHTIHNLYCKFSIDYSTILKMNDKDDPIVNISLSGIKSTYVDNEIYTRYNHSHLANGVTNTWNDFCLGSSEFRNVVNQTKLSFTSEMWELLFYSLKQYVSWESLEGGPYAKINNTINYKLDSNLTYSTSEIEVGLAECIAKELPPIEIWENDFVINRNSSLLFDYFNKNSKLKSIYSNYGQNTVEKVIKAKQNVLTEINNSKLIFTFKGKEIKYNVDVNELIRKINESQSKEIQISLELINEYCFMLEKKMKKYIKTSNYDRFKQSSIFKDELVGTL